MNGKNKGKRPTLGVYFPNFNHAQYLPQALSAIFTQSRLPDEVIVVDDASTDHSLAVLEDFAARYPQLRILRNEKNLGAVPSLNIGLKACTADYVYATASDDLLRPGFFEKSLGLLEQYPQAALCCSFPSRLDAESQQISEVPINWSSAPRFLSPDNLAEVMAGYSIPGHSTIAKRELCLRAGGYREELRWHCDWYLWLSLGLRDGICFIPESLALQRVRADSYSASGVKSWNEQSQVLGRILDLILSEQREILPRFIRSGAMSNFGDAIVKLVMERPEYWRPEVLLLINQPLVRSGLSLPNPNWGLLSPYLQEDAETARQSSIARNYEVRLAKAYHLLNTGEYRLAEIEFSELVRVRESDMRALLGSSLVALQLAQHDTAQRFAELTECYAAQEPEVLNQVGVIYFKLGQEIKAEQVFKASLQTRPGNFDSSYNLAVLSARSANWAEAKEYLEQALRERPADPTALDLRAQIEQQISGSKAKVLTHH